MITQSLILGALSILVLGFMAYCVYEIRASVLNGRRYLMEIELRLESQTNLMQKQLDLLKTRQSVLAQTGAGRDLIRKRLEERLQQVKTSGGTQ